MRRECECCVQRMLVSVSTSTKIDRSVSQPIDRAAGESLVGFGFSVPFICRNVVLARSMHALCITVHLVCRLSVDCWLALVLTLLR